MPQPNQAISESYMVASKKYKSYWLHQSINIRVKKRRIHLHTTANNKKIILLILPCLWFPSSLNYSGINAATVRCW